MTEKDAKFAYLCRLGDSALVLGQRMIEHVAGMPDLEEELANANFALDYLGQARMFYSYAGEIEGAGRSEDDFAFQRDEREFHNLLLVEQPLQHFGDLIVTLVLFDTFYLAQLQALAANDDERLAGIAARAEREIRYHLRHTSRWLVRLGDGTEFSHDRMQATLDRLWRLTGEMFMADSVDTAFRDDYAGPDLDTIHSSWQETISGLLGEANLQQPDQGWMQTGGKAGQHSEAFGYLLAEMQSLPRAHPGATW